MPTIEGLLLYNAVWILVWALFNTTGIIFLFSHPRDPVSRAMQAHGIFVTGFVYLTFATSYFNVTTDPDIRYTLAAIRGLLSLPILGSGAWLTYVLWKAAK